MKTTAHYYFKKQYTMEDLFNLFWNKNNLTERSQKPQKAFKDFLPISYLESGTITIYYAETHFKGTFFFLMEPNNIPNHEMIDKDYIVKITPFDDVYERTHVYYDYTIDEILSRLDNNPDYKKTDNIEVEEKTYLTATKEMLSYITSIKSSKICEDGQRAEGSFTIKRLIAVDFPITIIRYKNFYQPWNSKCILFPENFMLMPGAIVPNQYNIKDKKFPKILQAFKEYFFELVADFQNKK